MQGFSLKLKSNRRKWIFSLTCWIPISNLIFLLVNWGIINWIPVLSFLTWLTTTFSCKMANLATLKTLLLLSRESDYLFIHVINHQVNLLGLEYIRRPGVLIRFKFKKLLYDPFLFLLYHRVKTKKYLSFSPSFLTFDYVSPLSWRKMIKKIPNHGPYGSDHPYNI